MGITGLGALIAIGLAYLAQSPRLLARMGLNSRRWEMQTRAFTGYAFALLLLTFGFFLAGVPLELPATTAGGSVTARPTASATADPDVTTDVVAAVDSADLVTATTSLPANANSLTPESGAFAGPPPGGATGEAPAEPAPDEATAAEAAEVTDSPTPAPSPTETATPSPTPSPTPTMTPSPTVTPTPTLTPTPIEGETAVVNTTGGTLWVRRLPGLQAQTLVLLQNGDVVILQPGHANQSGILWREVSTVAGVVGWVQAEFLE